MTVRIKYRSEPKDAFDTMAPINCLLKLFFLTNLTRKNGRIKITWSWPKQILPFLLVFAMAATLTLDRIIKIYYEGLAFNSMNLYDNLPYLSLFEYVVDLSCVYKFGRHINLTYFNLYKEIDKFLEPNNVMLKAEVLKVTLLFTVSWVFLTVMALVMWFQDHSPDEVLNFILWLIENIVVVMNNLTLIEMCSNIVQVEYRLKEITKTLQDFYSFADGRSMFDVPGIENLLFLPDSRRREMYLSKEESARKTAYPSKCLMYKYYHDIVWMNKCYLLLLEQTNFINKAFGPRVSFIFIDRFFYGFGV